MRLCFVDGIDQDYAVRCRLVLTELADDPR